MEACYVPLEVREDTKLPDHAEKAQAKTFKIFATAGHDLAKAISTATAIENGRIVSRDICG